MSRPMIVFDLDGTLVDTAPDLVATLNLIFEREGLPPVPYDEARKLIGGGARAMIVRGLEADRRTVTPERLDQLFREFVDHYTAHVADLSRPFPGVTDALDPNRALQVQLTTWVNAINNGTTIIKATPCKFYFAPPVAVP